jgi:hypothetical protein
LLPRYCREISSNFRQEYFPAPRTVVSICQSTILPYKEFLARRQSFAVQVNYDRMFSLWSIKKFDRKSLIIAQFFCLYSNSTDTNNYFLSGLAAMLAPQRFAVVSGGARIALRDLTIVGGTVSVQDAQKQVRNYIYCEECAYYLLH